VARLFAAFWPGRERWAAASAEEQWRRGGRSAYRYALTVQSYRLAYSGCVGKICASRCVLSARVNRPHRRPYAKQRHGLDVLLDQPLLRFRDAAHELLVDLIHGASGLDVLTDEHASQLHGGTPIVSMAARLPCRPHALYSEAGARGGRRILRSSR